MTKFYGCVSSLLYPFNMVTHMYLYGIASATTIAFSEFISGISYLLVLYFMDQLEEPNPKKKPEKYLTTLPIHPEKRRQQALLVSFLFGILQFIFWKFILDSPYLHAFWFGGGNATFAVMCAFVKQSMEETDHAIVGLFDHVTPHKTV